MAFICITVYFLKDKYNDTDHILVKKTDIARTRIQKLKAQLDAVISENVDQLGPFEAQKSRPTLSTCNGAACS